MKTHGENELIKLLHSARQDDYDLNLIQLLQKLSKFSDNTLIFHLENTW